MESQVEWPNLFIVGAPKAGTTTLYKWLNQHPDIFMSSQKELLYFCNFPKNFTGPDAEIINNMVVNDREQYLKYFTDGRNMKYRGEASTDYLSCPEAPINISDIIPNAKIIIILRDPVERAFSEHMHLVRDGLETLTFEEALISESQRIDNNWNTLYRHKTRSLYYKQIKRYLNNFPHQNVYIQLFRLLRDNPNRLLFEIFQFLEIEDHIISTSEKYNVSGEVRSDLIYNMTRGRILPKPIKMVIKLIVPSDCLDNIRNNINNLNLERRKNIPKKVEKELREYFKPDIKKLENLLETDLSCWYR